MVDKIFKCRVHDFSTDSIIEWDKHNQELEHEYNLRMECDCGKKIHIKPKQKLGPKSRRVPRGYKCEECTKKIINTPEIKEAGEITNA